MNLLRTVTVSIVDRNNDVSGDTLTFDFDTVQELDKDIENYIINVMEIRRADVLIEDFDNVLFDDEIEWLEKEYYEVN